MQTKEIIERNFSRYAPFYDKYADIQLAAAKRLLEVLPKGGVDSVLEIGCGTGNYTRLVRTRFPAARIKALDFSSRMIEVARQKLQGDGVEFITADAEEFDPDGPFDLVTSNAAFQWFIRPEETIRKFREALAGGGRLAFSTFGPKTFWELREMLDDGSGVASGGFLDEEALEKMLNGYFSNVCIKKLVVKEVYPSIVELLRKIRYTGVRGGGKRAFPWKSTEGLYRKRFGRIEVTYEIYLCSVDRY